MKKITTMMALTITLIFTQISLTQALSPLETLCEKGYRIDGQKVYFCENAYEPELEMEGVSVDSFEVLSSFPHLNLVKDENSVYCGSLKMEADPSSVELITRSNYYKDKDSVYMGCQQIKNSDPDTFEPLSNRNYAQDSNGVYFKGLSLPGANAETFEILLNGYSKDDSNVYHLDELIPEADANSFEIISLIVEGHYCGKYGIDAHDENYYYARGRVICNSSFDETLSNFSDLSNQTDYVEGIVWTVEQGITQGHADGSWRPDACITRSQLLKIILEYRFGDDYESQILQLKSSEDFSDVNSGDWDYDYVRLARALEIVEGYENNLFKPNDCVSRAEAMKMVVTALAPGQEITSSDPLAYWGMGSIMLDMDPNAWYAPHARFLLNSGFVGSKHIRPADAPDFDPSYYTQILGGLDANKKPRNFFPAEDMSRKEVAYLIYKLRNISPYPQATEPEIISSDTQSSKTILESTYLAASSQTQLPYFYIEPEDNVKPAGIFIYMHGAGGDYEQGMSDDNYAGNFGNLKAALQAANFVYATPETSSFGEVGGKELVDFMTHLQHEYGTELPIYIAGASAGGKTIFYALENLENDTIKIKGAVFVVPALSSTFQTMEFNATPLNVWIEAGELDGVFPPDAVEKFELILTEKGHTVNSNIIPGGNHNAPVEQIDWESILKFLKN